MPEFHSAREAKEFLIANIVEEAERENIVLSEVERKMLYFSETYWSLPDIMEVSSEFDRDYDQTEYEKKIVKLVAKIDKRLRNGPREDYEKWRAAIQRLKKEDHYILVMINLAGTRRAGDQLRLFVTALVIVILLLGTLFLCLTYNVHPPPLGPLLWAVLCVLFGVYVLLALVLGKKRADNLVSRTLEKLVRFWQRLSGSA